MNDEKRNLAYKDYCAGMKYKAIAEKYNVSLSAVKSWASRYWKVATKEKKLRPDKKKVATKKNIKKKLLESVDENENLTEKRRLFCLYYATSHNATQSYLKAYQSDKSTAMVNGSRLLRDAEIDAEVKRLREIIRVDMDVDVSDMIRYCLKIVGADIGDYLSFESKEVKDDDGEKFKINLLNFKESSALDTSIVDEVKKGKDGISIKLADKKWAWDKLERYFGWNPQDAHKIKFDTEKLKIEHEKVAVMRERYKAGDDGSFDPVTIVDDME